MRAAIATLGAFGLALLVTGLPPLRRIGYEERVSPYLNGLGGRATLAPSQTPRQSAPLEWLQRNVAPLLPTGDAALVARLATSGTGLSIQAFRIEQLLWATVATGVATACVAVAADGSPLLSATTAMPLAAVGAAAARGRWLTREIALRRERVRHELPVAMDLLTLAIMAGESVPAALGRVGGLLEGDVAAEFRRAYGSLRAGATVADAIGELAQRLPHASAARLADSLMTAIDRGAPLADTLRAQADDLRQARRRDLLEMGGRREIAMLVPVVFLILPTLVVFVLLPGLVSLDLLVL